MGSGGSAICSALFGARLQACLVEYIDTSPYPHISLCVYPSIFLSIYLFYLSNNICTYLSIYLSIDPSIYAYAPPDLLCSSFLNDLHPPPQVLGCMMQICLEAPKTTQEPWSVGSLCLCGPWGPFCCQNSHTNGSTVAKGMMQNSWFQSPTIQIRDTRASIQGWSLTTNWVALTELKPSYHSPNGPYTAHLRTLLPQTIPGIVFGTRVLSWALNSIWSLRVKTSLFGRHPQVGNSN